MARKSGYTVCVRSGFSAAHSLRGYSGDCERVHGHNWSVEVAVACDELDELGMGIDFRELKRALGEVLERLDHENLNDLPEFSQLNPSSENIARYIFTELAAVINGRGRRVARVRVGETETAFVEYSED